MEEQNILKAEFMRYAAGAGADSAGVADVAAYSALVPNGQVPGYVAEGMKRVVVYTKHLFTGALALHDVTTTSLNSHLALDEAVDLGFLLCEWLEARGHAAVLLHPEFADEELCRGGGGLLDLKHAAEFAGLGHIGLNENFLTPDYGPRVYLGALLTNADMEPDAPGDPLCPGMRCGRCAVVCPTEAIPQTAPKDACVDEYKGLDKRVCSEGATRLGIRSLFLVLKRLVAREGLLDLKRVFGHRYWQDFWIAMNSKRGAYAACFECLYVCPIGKKNARWILKNPYRRQDIRGGVVQRGNAAGQHEVVHVGPPADREHEYSRHREAEEMIGGTR